MGCEHDSFDRYGACDRYGETCEEVIDRLRAELAEKDKRIEELEWQQDIHCQTIQDLVCEDSHVRITDAQIDAAWEFNGDSDAETRAHGEAMLYSCFGIERCEECGGSGKSQISGPRAAECTNPYCPDCNGHGWVKK